MLNVRSAGNERPRCQPINLAPAGDISVHALREEATGAIPSVVDDVKHLTKRSRNAQRIVIDIERLALGGWNVLAVRRRDTDTVKDAKHADCAGMLRFGR